jgi:Staphylococcal nuclease homologue
VLANGLSCGLDCVPKVMQENGLRARPRRLVCLTLMIVAAASQVAAAQIEACPAPDPTPVRLSATNRGTTFSTATGAEVVLSGLAFPQLPGGKTSAAPGVAAILANFESQSVRLAPAASPDRYGRLHAYAYTSDGRLLQAELVAAGLAVVRPEGMPPDCVRMLLALEDSARTARLGLWRDSNIIANASEESSLSARSGLYGLVEGRVVSIGYGSRLVFVDFGRNYRTDFTVMMQNALVPRLRDAGISLDSLSGRAVRVRGVIEESGGPAIRIADPFALELLDRTE